MPPEFDEEELPEATPYVQYWWDCPVCTEINDAQDIEPSGVVECEHCNEKVMIR